MSDAVVIAEEREESIGYRFSWGLAFAGAFAATAVTFFLLTLGSGVGLLLVNPVNLFGSVDPNLSHRRRDLLLCGAGLRIRGGWTSGWPVAWAAC